MISFVLTPSVSQTLAASAGIGPLQCDIGRIEEHWNVDWAGMETNSEQYLNLDWDEMKTLVVGYAV